MSVKLLLGFCSVMLSFDQSYAAVDKKERQAETIQESEKKGEIPEDSDANNESAESERIAENSIADLKLQKAIDRKARSLWEFENLLKEEEKKTTKARQKEVTILIKDVESAVGMLSSIRNTKSTPRPTLLKEVQHFNENMRQIEASYKRLVQMNQFDLNSEEQIDRAESALPPSDANNTQSIDALNWQRKVRFDEIFNPLEVSEDPGIAKPSNLPVKTLPENVMGYGSATSGSEPLPERNPDDILKK